MGSLSTSRSNYYSPVLSQVEGARFYTKLKKEIEGAGILDRDYFFYIKTILFVVVSCSLGIYLIFISTNFITTFISGLIFAFFAVHITGIFHDAGHRAIFNSVKNNDIVGYIACFFLAYTFKKWKVNHNKHHAHPNQEEMDPDIERPMFSFNEDQMRSKKGLWRTISKLQFYLYYPIGSLAGIFTQLANIYYFLKEREKSKYWEKALYIIGIMIWIAGPLIFFELSKAIAVFLSVYPLMGFYLFNVFAPNHKGMPQVKKGQKISFFEQQIITSRNVKGNKFIDFIYLGLNWQIEHHLFTYCPRNKLRDMSPFVIKICKEAGLDYTSVGIIKSNKIILSELKEVSFVV